MEWGRLIKTNRWTYKNDGWHAIMQIKRYARIAFGLKTDTRIVSNSNYGLIFVDYECL